MDFDQDGVRGANWDANLVCGFGFDLDRIKLAPAIRIQISNRITIRKMNTIGILGRIRLATWLAALARIRLGMPIMPDIWIWVADRRPDAE